MKQPAVYILASWGNGTLYIAVTSDLVQRVWQRSRAARSKMRSSTALNCLARCHTTFKNHRELLCFPMIRGASSTPARIRTWDLRFRKPMVDDCKAENSKELDDQQSADCTTACTKKPETDSEHDPDLGRIVAAWPGLARKVRASILAMVDKATRSKRK